MAKAKYSILLLLTRRPRALGGREEATDSTHHAHKQARHAKDDHPYLSHPLVTTYCRAQRTKHTHKTYLLSTAQLGYFLLDDAWLRPASFACVMVGGGKRGDVWVRQGEADEDIAATTTAPWPGFLPSKKRKASPKQPPLQPTNNCCCCLLACSRQPLRASSSARRRHSISGSRRRARRFVSLAFLTWVAAESHQHLGDLLLFLLVDHMGLALVCPWQFPDPTNLPPFVQAWASCSLTSIPHKSPPPHSSHLPHTHPTYQRDAHPSTHNISPP